MYKRIHDIQSHPTCARNLENVQICMNLAIVMVSSSRRYQCIMRPLVIQIHKSETMEKSGQSNKANYPIEKCQKQLKEGHVGETL